MSTTLMLSELELLPLLQQEEQLEEKQMLTEYQAFRVQVDELSQRLFS